MKRKSTTTKAAAASDPERRRLASDPAAWKAWGPYLSERQWGTVREDYSPHGNAWEYLPHDHARSRAYRWGEDGIGGLCDEQARLCLSVALWNGRDPILKERFFGLTNGEGNHGEDVKELYYYLDGTPTHSYMRMLYKYPQREFPYAGLVAGNRARGPSEPELELEDTGVFDDGRYFDVVVEHAKASPEDIVLRVTAHNRGPEEAVLHVLPQAWFRNTWSWRGGAKPLLRRAAGARVEACHESLGRWQVHFEDGGRLLFTENETNARRLFGADREGFAKDAFHEAIVNGREDAVNPAEEGTKVASHHVLRVPAGASREVCVRLSRAALDRPMDDVTALVAMRRAEADLFHDGILPLPESEDARLVRRQAFAGMLWSKQFYCLDVAQWLEGDPLQPPPPPGRSRNAQWEHLNNAEVISMPDAWEYPWYAAWDLAFHCVPLARLDPAFAKEQLLLLTREWYMHPNGQIPAYEWAFGDVNPPVHAWAAWRVFEIDREARGDAGDLAFLERVFQKLLLNFTWWVNRKDADGRNVFQGGFLGLDNIGVFDRSAPLPHGGRIAQADGTAWMAMYSLNLLRIALELARHDDVHEDIATKFFEHFLHIAKAMTGMGREGIGLWDDEDGFFHDVFELPDGRKRPLKVRSMVGLVPLFAVEVLEPGLLRQVPGFARRLEWFLEYRPDLASLVSRWQEPGQGERRLLSLLRGHRMKRILRRMLDETEFLSPHGVRSLSRHHLEHPYSFLDEHGEHGVTVRYQPAESGNGLFGGNSNWRGPVWFPMNHLLVESLRRFHAYYGDDFKVECPTGSGTFLTLAQVADELARRLSSLFLADASGRRPVHGRNPGLHAGPHFREYPLFFEYFDGDTGRGVGASHQTGWTGLVTEMLATPPAAGRAKEAEGQDAAMAAGSTR